MPVIRFESKLAVPQGEVYEIARIFRTVTAQQPGLLVRDDDPTIVIIPSGVFSSDNKGAHSLITVDGLDTQPDLRNTQVCNEFAETLGRTVIDFFPGVAFHVVTVHIRAYQGRWDLVRTFEKEFTGPSELLTETQKKVWS